MNAESIAAFWSRVDRRADDECWPWTGPGKVGGYGGVSVASLRGPIAAHRIAFGLANNGIPDGLYVLHTCDNPPCCNPAHLWAGTHLENMLDMRTKGRSSAGAEPKTHCKRGHLVFHSDDDSRAGEPCQKCIAIRTEKERAARVAAWHIRALAWLGPYLPDDSDGLDERLPFRHAAVLKSAYGLYGCEVMPSSEIARVLGVTRQRVEQLIDAALTYLGASAVERPRLPNLREAFTIAA